MGIEIIIQASNPRFELISERDFEGLSDAVESLFPLYAEHMFIIWNGIYVPLSYKYDFSLMIDDVLVLITELLAHGEGRREIHWPSNTFAAVWTAQWTSGTLKIESKWSRVVGGTESLLAQSGPIILPIDDFVAEWKRPLQVVQRALLKAGFVPDGLPGFSTLCEVVARLPRYGQLYDDVSLDAHSSSG